MERASRGERTANVERMERTGQTLTVACSYCAWSTQQPAPDARGAVTVARREMQLASGQANTGLVESLHLQLR